MKVKLLDPLLNKEFNFTTSKNLVVSYQTNVFHQYEVFLSYHHSGEDVIPQLETMVSELSPSNGLNIEISYEDGNVLKTLRGNIREYVFRSQINLTTGKVEPREQVTITIFK